MTKGAKGVVYIEDHPTSWGAGWKRDPDDALSFSFDEGPFEHRTVLWLDLVGGDAVDQIIKAGVAHAISRKPGPYGGYKRTVKIDVQELDQVCDAYWDRINAQDKPQHVCHYCGLPATGVDFFGSPTCPECGGGKRNTIKPNRKETP